MNSLTRAGITVSGRVQGVGFRMWVKHQARSLDLSGFVRNCPDGSVYVEAEGGKERVMQLISLCSTGPERSQVVDISYSFMPPTGTPEFIIR